MLACSTLQWTLYSDPDRRRIIMVLSGEVTADRLVAAQQALWTAAGAHQFDELLDYRACSASALLAQELAEHARREHLRLPTQQPRRQAILVADDVMYGLGRMFKGWYGDGPAEVDVFRDLAAAEAWLDNSPNRTG